MGFFDNNCERFQLVFRGVFYVVLLNVIAVDVIKQGILAKIFKISEYEIYKQV